MAHGEARSRELRSAVARDDVSTRVLALYRTVLFAAALILAACSSTPERPATYTVKRGDTLYAIAWRHRIDYRDLARWNGVGRSHLIHPGQVLRLYPPSGRSAQAVPSTSPPKPAPTRRNIPAVHWQWPVAGGRAASTTRPNGGRGLTISGAMGADVRAAGDGRVVYTGAGLLGYGQLVIIKHNDVYLSAYGHTQSVAVQEGQNVTAGQRIGAMGAGPQGGPMLYFEIRVDGAPVDPLMLLPQR